MPGEIRSVGFIGLGDMGARQAREIAKLRFSLTVFDVRAEAMKPFEGKARLASSVAELGSVSDLVGICVVTDAQVRACIDELLPAIRRSTGAPSAFEKIARSSGRPCSPP